MNAKDFEIYQEIAKVAAAVFDNIQCAPGKYAPADIAKYVDIEEIKEYNHKYNQYVVTGVKYQWKNGAPFGWAENYDPCQIHAVSVDTFSCTFNSWGVFAVLKKVATAWEIPAAYKCTLIREKETAAAVVSFNVPAVAKDIIKVPVANVKDQPEKIAYHFVAVDTRRRCLVVTNGNILTAVAVDEMNVAKDAAAVYLISPELLKTGKGTVEIDVNGNAANGGACFPVATDLQFPRWEKVLPAVQDARAVEIGNKQFKQLKKEITAAAKSANKYCPVVTISGKTGNDYLTISAADIDFSTENSRRVSLPQPCAFDFVFPVAAKLFASVPAAEKIYLAAEYLPYLQKFSGVLIFAAAKMFSLYLPTKSENEEIPAPAAEDAPAVAVLKVCRFPDVQETAAAVDEETPAVYAVPADRMPQETAAAVQDEETPAADSITAPAVETPAVAVQDAPDVANAAAADSVPAVDEETAPDVQETPAAANVPAAAANDIETLLNKQFEMYLAAVAVAQHEKEMNAVDAVAVEITADEETAPAVAVSLPAVPVPADSLRWAFENGFITEKEYICTVWNVAVYDENGNDITAPAAEIENNFAAVYPLHAVYIDGVLHGVYFSKLLADAVLFDAFFAGRSVYPLQILSNETAPETERAAVLFAADSVPAVDEETANVQDEETAAPADSVPAAADPFASVWACMQETPAVDAPDVAQDEETPAVLIGCPADEETPAVGVQDAQETPAVLIAYNFARRFRRVWQTAAAVLFLIVCAAVPVAVDAPAVETPAVLFEDAPAVETPAVLFEDAPAVAVPADSVPAAVQDAQETPAVGVSVAADSITAAAADSVPSTAKKQPQTAKKRARRGNSRRAVSFAAVAADSLAQPAPADSVPAVLFAADSLAAVLFAADSLAADSLYLPADSITAAPADSVPADSITAPAVAVSVPADSVPAAKDEETPAVDEETAPAVQETPAADSVPAVDEETPQDEETPAPADSVPAANSPAPAVPVSVPVAAVSAPAVPAVTPYVIGCNFIH